MPDVVVREVGLRDGLQMAKQVLSTQRKIAWFEAEAEAGVGEFEITSFVPAKIVPQFHDAVAVVQGTAAKAAQVSSLVPNLKGAELAFAAGAAKVNFVMSASEMHNQANVRRSTAESLEAFRQIAAARAARARPVRLAAGVATSFGCTIQGQVPEARVFELVDALVAAGADEIIIADTVGYGDPFQVRRIFAEVLKRTGDRPVYAHFHDTRGLGLANVVAALETGVRRFDASLGGLGGCPFAPGATGNINTEDCVFLLERLGFRTGIDIDRLIRLRERVAPWIPEESLTGAIARAGLPKGFQPAS